MGKIVANVFKFIAHKLSGSQLRRNVSSGFLATGLGVIVAILKYPLYLHFLDYEIYGSWLMLATLMGMAKLGMLGIGPAITKLVAEELGKDDIGSVEKYVSTAILTLLISGLFIVSFILLLKLQVLNLLGFEGTSRVVGETYLVYVCLLTILVFLYQVINATIAGLGRMDIANYSQTVLQLLPLLISVPMLIAGKGVASLLVGNVFAYIFVSIANIFFISRIFKIRIFAFSNISITYFKKLMKFGVPVFGSSIAAMFFSPVTKIFISNYIGIAAVPIYEVASKAATQVLGLLNMAFKALMPELSRLSSEKTEQSLRRAAAVKRKAYRIIVFGGGGLSLFLFLTSPYIFKVWLGSEYRLDITLVFRVLIVGMFFSMVTLVQYYNLLALGRTKEFFIYHIMFPGVNIAALCVMFLILNKNSILCAAYANLIGLVAGFIYLNFYTKKMVTKKYPMVELG